MLTSENLSDVGHMLTEGPIPMFIEEIIRRLCQEVVGSTVARASDMRRVDKEVMRWIWFDLDEQFCISELRPETCIRILHGLNVLLGVAADMWLHVPEFPGESSSRRRVGENKAGAASLMGRSPIHCTDLTAKLNINGTRKEYETLTNGS